MRRVLFVVAAFLVVASVVPAMAQDAVKVDSKHYKVEFENDQVRVLRITYAPSRKVSDARASGQRGRVPD